MAPAIRTLGVQIAFPAPDSGCLANDRVLRLSGLQLYRFPVSSLRGQGHQLHPTCLAGRGRNNAMADNHGRGGTPLGRSIPINLVDSRQTRIHPALLQENFVRLQTVLIALVLLLARKSPAQQVFDSHVHLWEGEKSLRQYETEAKTAGIDLVGFGGMWLRRA